MLCALFCLPGAAAPAEWVVEPSLGARVDYNNNYTLTAVKQPTWVGTLTPLINFSRNTEASSVTGAIGFSIIRFSNNLVGPDQVNPRLNLVSALQEERDTYRFNASYLTATGYATTLTAQGLTTVNALTNSLVVNPGWTRALTERTSLGLDYVYQQTTFDTPGLIDYHSQSLTASLQHRYSERLLLLGSLAASQFQTTNDSTKSLTYSINAGGTYDWSERTKATLTVGSALTDTTNRGTVQVCPGPLILCQLGLLALQTLPTQSEASVRTLLVNGNFTSQLTENQTLSGQIGRNVLPSAAGQVLATDTASLSYSYQPAPTLVLSVSAQVAQSNLAQATNNAGASQYLSIAPRLTWNIDPWLDLGLGYTFSTTQTKSGNGISPQSQAVFLTLQYRPQRLSVAR